MKWWFLFSGNEEVMNRGLVTYSLCTGLALQRGLIWPKKVQSGTEDQWHGAVLFSSSLLQRSLLLWGLLLCPVCIYTYWRGDGDC